jgi:hypothetical protein
MILASATLAILAAAAPARAQVVATTPPTVEPSGWTFAVAPYVWLPTLRATLNANTPRRGTVATTISAGPGDIIPKLNFQVMVGGEARYDRFTIMSDLIYVNASLTTSTSHVASFNPGRGPIFIPREQQLRTGTRLATTVWSVGGGYTLLQGDWGNVDAVVGMRMLAVGDTTNYALANDILLPNQTIGLSRTGTLNVNKTDVQGIGGVKGRINIPNSSFYVPFYADVGGGALPLTWQVYTGIAYRAAAWVDLSLGYRYLAFENGGNKGVHNLSLGGVILGANFRF